MPPKRSLGSLPVRAPGRCSVLAQRDTESRPVPWEATGHSPASDPGPQQEERGCRTWHFRETTCREGDWSGPEGWPHPSSQFPGPQDILVTGGAEASQMALSLAGPSSSSCHRGRGRPAPAPRQEGRSTHSLLLVQQHGVWTGPGRVL